MTITTRFDIGNVVWRMQNNKAVVSTIIAVEVYHASLFSKFEPLSKARRTLDIYYRISDDSGSERLLEKELFASKGDLLDSL